MNSVSIQFNTDPVLKSKAAALFNQLGMDMSTALNMFLRQCVATDALPPETEFYSLKPEVLEAMDDARRISQDPNAKTYSSFAELLKEIDDNDV